MNYGNWKARKVDDQQWDIDIKYKIKNTLGYNSWSGSIVVFGSDDSPDEGRKIAKAHAKLIQDAPKMLKLLHEITLYGGYVSEEIFEKLCDIVNKHG